MRKLKKLGLALLAATLTFASAITSQAGVLTRVPGANGDVGREGFDHWGYYYTYNGVQMNCVFTAGSYLEYNPDLKEWARSLPNPPGTSSGPNMDWERAVFEHFITYGTREGRKASSTFDVKCYMAHNPDLVAVFGTEDLLPYYVHFAQYGRYEGRIATGVIPVDDTYVDLTNPGIEGVHYVMKDGLKMYLLSDSNIFYNTSKGNVTPYHRTDFPDGVIDKNHNGMDDRDPLDSKGFYDLNHDSVDDRQTDSTGRINAMQEPRLNGQALTLFKLALPADSEYVECEHGVINMVWSWRGLYAKSDKAINCPQCKQLPSLRTCESWEKSKYAINWDQYIAWPQTEETVVQE